MIGGYILTPGLMANLFVRVSLSREEFVKESHKYDFLRLAAGNF